MHVDFNTMWQITSALIVAVMPTQIWGIAQVSSLGTVKYQEVKIYMCKCDTHAL